MLVQISRQFWFLVWRWLLCKAALLEEALLVALRERCFLHLHDKQALPGHNALNLCCTARGFQVAGMLNTCSADCGDLAGAAVLLPTCSSGLRSFC